MSKKALLISIPISLVVLGLILGILTKASVPPPREEGGEMPLIPSESLKEEREGKTVILYKPPFEACVEMVMHYWGTPPTEEESKALFRRSMGEGSNVYKVLKKHRLSFLWVASLDKETIKKICQLHIPIIASCNIGDFAGAVQPFHTFFVLKEFKDGRFVFNDPLTQTSMEMDADLFLNAYWLPSDTLALLVFPPSKKNLLKDIIPTPCIQEASELRNLEGPEGGNFTERIVRQLRERLDRKSSTYLTYLLGWYLSREGNEEGLVWLKKAYEMNPLPFYRAEYAIAHCYLHRNEEALRLLREFIKENPQYIALPNVFFHLCYLLSKKGEEEEIRRIFREAYASAPPHLLVHLVNIYSQLLPTYKKRAELIQGFFTKYRWAKNVKNLTTSLLQWLLWADEWQEAEKLLQQLDVKDIPLYGKYSLLTEAVKYICQGERYKAEEIYHQLRGEPFFAKILLGNKLGKWEDLRKELPVLIERFTPKPNADYEEKISLYVFKLYFLRSYIDVCVHLEDREALKKAIEDFVNIYENNVVLGYECYACYAYALGGLICYWDGEKERAREWLLKAYHSPYFKELDPQKVRDVKKALKELGRLSS